MKGTVFVILLLFVCLSLALVDISPHAMRMNKIKAAKAKRADAIEGCIAYFCAGDGEDCGQYTDETGVIVNQTYCTNSGYGCSKTGSTDTYISGTCVPIPQAGDPCMQSFRLFDICGGDLLCVNTATTGFQSCETVAEPGSHCTIGVDYCRANPAVNCSTGICPYANVSQSCDVFPCLAGLFCAQTKCVKLLPDGSACNISLPSNCANFCLPNTTDSLTGYCAYEYTHKEGEPCFIVDDCVLGLYCDNSAQKQFGVCRQPTGNSTTQNKVCSSVSDCTPSNGESCSCRLFQSTPICLQEINHFDHYNVSNQLNYCLAENGCNIYTPLNCSACFPDLCKYLPVFFNYTEGLGKYCEYVQFMHICNSTNFTSTTSSNVLASTTSTSSLSTSSLSTSSISTTSLSTSSLSSTTQGSTSLSSTTLGSTTLGSTTLGSTTLGSTTLGSTTLSSTTLNSTTLSTLNTISATLSTSSISTSSLTSILSSLASSIPSTISPAATATSASISSSTTSTSSANSGNLTKNNTSTIEIVAPILVGTSLLIVGIAVSFLLIFAEKDSSVKLEETKNPPEHTNIPAAVISVTVSNGSNETPGNPAKKIEIFDVEVGEELEAGVYDGKWHGARVAIKTLGPENVSQLPREAELLRKLRHPNIVRFMGVYKKDGIYMVTEFVDGGSLESLLRKQSQLFSTLDLIRISAEIAAGMILLEHKGIIHRDLATRSILVDTKTLTAKVSNFGMSRVYQEYEASSTTELPLQWASPEVIDFRKFSTKSDVWAFGVVLYEIFTFGKVPYGSMSNKEAAMYVLAGNRLSIPPNTPAKIGTIMNKCWRADAQYRPTFKAIFNVLNEVLLVAKSEQFISAAMLDP